MGGLPALANGNPDTSFGTVGHRPRRLLAGSRRRFGELLLAKSGKLVMVGSTRLDATGLYGGPIGLARLKSDGKPDPTFGKQGKLTLNLDPSGAAVVWAIIQKDGRIVTLNRLNAGGQIHMALTRHLVSPGTAGVDPEE